MGRKHRCRACQRKRLEERERSMLSSWLCVYYDDVWCPHSGIPRERRIDTVCLSCSHSEEFERQMEEEEAEEAEFIEAVEKDPKAYLRGEI
jgi:hypothetical protein